MCNRVVLSNQRNVQIPCHALDTAVADSRPQVHIEPVRVAAAHIHIDTGSLKFGRYLVSRGLERSISREVRTGSVAMPSAVRAPCFCLAVRSGLTLCAVQASRVDVILFILNRRDGSSAFQVV